VNKFKRISYGGSSSVPEDASLLSVRQVFALPEPVGKEKVQNGLLKIFRKLIPSISVNGIIPGHLKASIKEGSALLALSATRSDSVDQTPNADWTELNTLQNFEIRINLLSIIPCSVSQEELEEMVHNLTI
jgi:hypothetical protein